MGRLLVQSFSQGGWRKVVGVTTGLAKGGQGGGGDSMAVSGAVWGCAWWHEVGDMGGSSPFVQPGWM